MNFGKLNRKIELQTYSESRTSSGSYTKTWSKEADLWAKVVYKSGGEKIEADQEQAYNKVEFTVRFCTSININEKQRILYNENYFDIEYVNEIGFHNYLEIITKRKTIWQEK